MALDTIVFDIETQNFFTDPDVGWDNFDALKISVVGLYSYAKDAYVCLEESELEALAAWFRDAHRLVGFSMNRYDVPVLHRYFQSRAATRDVDLWQKDRVDLLEEIELASGYRVSLDKLAEANLGEKKTGDGAKAIKLFREGKIEELKEYCRKDVELTKRLYDLYRKQAYLLVPDRTTGSLEKIPFDLPHA